MPRRLALGLTAGAVLWIVMLAAAPAALHHPHAGPVAATVYASASRICHQRPERSFTSAGVQLPVCARCLGLYVAGAAGALFAWTAGAASPRRPRRALLLAAVPTAVTWSAEMAGLAGFSNEVRALAALPLGAVAGWVSVQMLRYDAPLNGVQVHDSRSHVHHG